MKPLTREELEVWKAEKAGLIVKRLKIICKGIDKGVSSALEKGPTSEKLRNSIAEGFWIVNLVRDAKDYGVLSAFQPERVYLCRECVKLHICAIANGHIKKLRASEEKCAFCNGKAIYYSEKLTRSKAYFFIEKAQKEDAQLAIFCAECFLFIIDYAKELWFTQTEGESGCSLFPIQSEFHVTTSFFGKIPEPLAERYEEMRRTPITHPMVFHEKTTKFESIPIIEKASKCEEPEETAEKLDRLTAYLPEIIKEEVNKQLNEKIEKELGYLRSLIIGKRNVKKEITELLRKEGPLKPSEIAKKIKAKHATVRVLLWRLTKKGVVTRKRGKYSLSKNLRR